MQRAFSGVIPSPVASSCLLPRSNPYSFPPPPPTLPFPPHRYKQVASHLIAVVAPVAAAEKLLNTTWHRLENAKTQQVVHRAAAYTVPFSVAASVAAMYSVREIANRVDQPESARMLCRGHEDYALPSPAPSARTTARLHRQCLPKLSGGFSLLAPSSRDADMCGGHALMTSCRTMPCVGSRSSAPT